MFRSHCSPFFLSGPPLLLFPVVDALLNAVMLSTPFVLPARPYVHLHGVCSPLSDVHAGNNCFPVPLVASVAALVLLHWVSERTCARVVST